MVDVMGYWFGVDETWFGRGVIGSEHVARDIHVSKEMHLYLSGLFVALGRM
jgi:hypothetical protein